MSTDETSDERLIGTVTAGYRVLSRIGSGTMGHVYEAEDVNSGRHVALKVLHRNHQKDLAARFLREGKTLALLSHPNIVQLVDMGQLDDGALFLATELIGGDSLRVVMDRGPLEPRRALVMVRQLLDALDAAHGLGVVHRDIKPENVMIADGDAIKVLDFGVAKLLADTVAGLGEANLTSVGFSIFGSALYIAPESVTGQPVDARIDIYSTGAMLFEMLTGRPVFDDEDPTVVLRHHAFDPPPTLHQVAPTRTFAPEIEALVARTLAKLPDARYRSAADMIAAVDGALRALEPAAGKRAMIAEPRVAATPAAADARRARTEVVRVSSRRKIAIVAASVSIATLAMIVAVGAGSGGGSEASKSDNLATRAGALRAAGKHHDAVVLIEPALAELPEADQGSAYLALGHSRFALGRVRQALGAYERALRARPALGDDKELRANLESVLQGKDVVASIVALDLLASLIPPAHEAIVTYASEGKLEHARHRALMIAERDGLGDKVDRVPSWLLDLQQSSSCDERKATIELLARSADQRAVVVLRRMRSIKCIQREATEAIARITNAAESPAARR